LNQNTGLGGETTGVSRLKFSGTLTITMLYFVAGALYLWNVYRHWTYLEDDPLIVFRYAINFHSGHGWVMNAGEHVNGCTSFFGLVLVTILSKFLSIDTSVIVLKAFVVIAGLIVLWKSKQIAGILLPEAPYLAALAPLLLAYRTDFSLAMTNGMETPYACVFFLCAFTSMYKTEANQSKTAQWQSVALFALAGLSRPELTVVYPALVLLKLAHKEKIDFRQLIAYSIPFVCLGIFNLAFYHSIVPNTYYAKLVNTPDGRLEGVEYVAQYLLFPLLSGGGIVSFLCLLAVANRSSRFTEIYLVSVGLCLLFLLRTSGDWMVDGRFAMPVLPLIVASWLVGLHTASTWILQKLHGRRGYLAAIGIAASATLLTAGYFDYRHREAYVHQCSRIRSFSDTLQTSAPLSTWMAGAPDGRRRISDWLAKHALPGQTVAMPEMGLIPCLNPEIKFIDVEGLTDAAIARMPIPHGPYGVHAGPDWDNLTTPMGKYIEQRKPEYVISAFSDGTVIRNPNYIKVAGIVAYVDNSGKYRFIIYKRKS